MSNDSTYVTTIVDFERMGTSRNGNPQYRVHFADGSMATTKADASIAYTLPNPELRDVPVRITVNGRGQVWNIETVTE